MFGYCGGLSPHKGVHILVSAFRSLKASDVELRIYGSAAAHETDYERGLRNRARRDPRIRFYGTFPHEQLSKILSELDVVVIPSLVYETYSLILHEARAFNVPVIASGLGALADPRANLSFTAGSESELTEKLKLVIESPALLDDLSKQAAKIDFSLEEEEAWAYELIYAAARNAGRSPVVDCS